jgi:excisionase family DNA binding protein
VCLLIVIGVCEDGEKELLAVEDGYRESTESRAGVFRDMKRRGLNEPRLVIGDGATPRECPVDATDAAVVRSVMAVRTDNGAEVMNVKTDEVERLRRALRGTSDEVRFEATLPRSTAEKVLKLLSEEEKAGAIVIPARNELRTSEAAAVLGVSRSHLSRLINEGQIDARMVGSHWRIPAQAIIEFQEREADERSSRLDELMEFQNKAGFIN